MLGTLPVRPLICNFFGSTRQKEKLISFAAHLTHGNDGIEDRMVSHPVGRHVPGMHGCLEEGGERGLVWPISGLFSAAPPETVLPVAGPCADETAAAAAAAAVVGVEMNCTREMLRCR